MEYGYLLTLCCILLSTKFLGLISRRAQLPQVVGALTAGLFFGPAVLGELTQSVLGFQLCLQPSVVLDHIGELGVIVIMFSAGMHTSISDLRNSGKPGLLVAVCGVVVPLAMGAGLIYIFEPDSSMIQALFVGAVLTATSVSITVETLSELGKLSTKSGNTILAAALIDDILGLICLAVISGLAGESVNIALIIGKIALFFAAIAVIGYMFKKFIIWSDTRHGERNLRRYPVIGFAMCLFLGWAAEEVFGVADIIGAFAAGMIIAMSPKGRYIASKFDTISYLLLTPVFFANIGMKVTIPHISADLMLFTAALIAAGILSKLIGCGLGAKMCGYTDQESVRVGLGMACRGEVALIVAGKGIAVNMLNPNYIGPIIILIMVCAIFTPILLKRAYTGRVVNIPHSPLTDRFHFMERIEHMLHTSLKQ